MKTQGRSILIVDDAALIVKRLIAMLNGLPSVESINTASNYREAIAVLKDTAIDIAILDIHLGGKNGIELLKYVKGNFPGVEVVMLTNAGNEKYRELCKKEGARYFIDKSREFEMIPDILANLN
jgi:DNA-binding NarL/FixJ family response regulator